MRRSIDTTVEARRRQLDAYRAMTPEQRLRLADQMSTEIRSVARAGIRARLGGHPAESDVEAELARILHRAGPVASVRSLQPRARQ